MKNKEIFEDIKEVNGLFKVSNFGRILDKDGKEKKPFAIKDGYKMIQTSIGKKKIRLSVARLVAKKFVDGYFDGAVVRYLDGNKSNCHHTNLAWSKPAYGSQGKRIPSDKELVKKHKEMMGYFLSPYSIQPVI